jgi:hypothetical protein
MILPDDEAFGAVRYSAELKGTHVGCAVLGSAEASSSEGHERVAVGGEVGLGCVVWEGDIIFPAGCRYWWVINSHSL